MLQPAEDDVQPKYIVRVLLYYYYIAKHCQGLTRAAARACCSSSATVSSTPASGPASTAALILRDKAGELTCVHSSCWIVNNARGVQAHARRLGSDTVPAGREAAVHVPAADLPARICCILAGKHHAGPGKHEPPMHG